jgi:hypothetical protein
MERINKSAQNDLRKTGRRSGLFLCSPAGAAPGILAFCREGNDLSLEYKNVLQLRMEKPCKDQQAVDGRKGLALQPFVYCLGLFEAAGLLKVMYAPALLLHESVYIAAGSAFRNTDIDRMHTDSSFCLRTVLTETSFTPFPPRGEFFTDTDIVIHGGSSRIQPAV